MICAEVGWCSVNLLIIEVILCQRCTVSMQPAVSEGWDSDAQTMVYRYLVKFIDHYMVLLTTKARNHEYPFSEEWVQITNAISTQVFTARDLLLATQSKSLFSRI